MSERVRSRRARGGDERGAVIVVAALIMTSLLIMASIVIDLGQLRAGRRYTQTLADLAALAAGTKLNPNTRNPVAACQLAIDYFNANAVGAPAAISAAGFCAPFASATCSPISEATPRQVVGDYAVEVHWPVPDAEIVDPKTGGAHTGDGGPCDRMRVIIERGANTFFAGVMGVNRQTATASAVVRSVVSPAGAAPPALMLLDPTGCIGLKVAGTNTRVTVGSATITGAVAIDSDGSSCSSTTVSTTGGAQLRLLPASGTGAGHIDLYAMAPGQTSCATPPGNSAACNPADITGGNISPQPIRLPFRITRSSVDWRFNCKTGYPAYHGLSLPGCPYTTPAYVDNLASALGTGLPPGYQRWTTAHSCNASSAMVSGNWWVDCPGGFSLGGGAAVTFAGGNVVFEGDVSVTGGTLSINTANPTANLGAACTPPTVTVPCIAQSSQNAAFMYLRNGGNVTVNSGAIILNHTALIQTTSGANGYVKLAGGSPPEWSAPTEGPFNVLALWSETPTNKYLISGGASLNLSGVFFTPEANAFTISGGSPTAQQLAQFISYQLAVSGGADLTLVPPSYAVSPPTQGASLIR